MTLTTIILRLLAAAVIGFLIGLNRFAHHQDIGVRTLGIVSLGAAGLVVAALETGTGSATTSANVVLEQGRFSQALTSEVEPAGTECVEKWRSGRKNDPGNGFMNTDMRDSRVQAAVPPRRDPRRSACTC